MLGKYNFETSADERRNDWAENMFSQGDDAHYWDYADCIARLLFDAMESLEAIVGKDAAAEPLRLLVANAATSPSQKGSTDWRVLSEDTLFVGTMWPISEKLFYAAQYGIYGVTPKEVPVIERNNWISNVVAEVSAFAFSAITSSLGANNPVSRIARIARSRRALDLGFGEVDLESLSILANVSDGRLRNLLSGPEPVLERGNGGGVAASSALVWLKKRKDFFGSIWMHEDAVEADAISVGSAASFDSERLIFVPVARDGSTFHPGLKRAGAYQIGAKGEESHFDSFDEALTALNAMPVPRWRRPNEQGNWGIVSGVAWQRIERGQERVGEEND